MYLHTHNPYTIASNPSLNIWVSASAGSGKTTILVNRFLRLLLNGIDPKKILCITFTNNAASEMIHRILGVLSSWTVCDTIELEQKIKNLISSTPSQKILNTARQLFIKCVDEQHNLQIQTIHSFCQSILNKFPLEAGISSDAEIIDDYQKSIFIDRSKNDLLQRYDKLCPAPEALDYLFENIHECSLQGLVDNSIFLNNLSTGIISSQEEKNNYTNIIKEKLNLNNSKDLTVIIAEFAEIVGQHKNYLGDAVDIEIVDCISKFITLDANTQKQKFPKLQNLFLTQKGEKRITLLKNKERKQYPKILELLNLLQDIVFQYNETLKSQKIARFTKGFINFAYEFNQQFAKHKSTKNSIDYNDLIAICLNLINNPELSLWLKYKLSNQITHIMIDEGQDTNFKQWQIIYACMEGLFSSDKQPTIFIVGDSKQAIYSFQGSSPEIFHGMHQYLQDFAQNCNSKIYDIKLSNSFRSDQLILKFVDTVFTNLIKNNPDHFPEDASNHISDLSSNEASIELWDLIISDQQKEIISPWEVKTDYETSHIPPKILADNIVNHVYKLITTTNTKASDIMILVRKRDKLVDYMIRAFKEKKIAVNGSDRLNLNKNLAIQDLMAVAKFILLPIDNYNLACLLKSPICDFSEDDLFKVAQREDLSLWENLSKLSKQNSELNQTYQFLNNLLENYDLHSPYNLFSYLLNIAKFRTNLLSRFGMQLDEVLNEFINIAMDFEQTSASLSEFVHFFENTNLEIKVNLDLKKEEVKIMTVHAAKGLESKIVILPDTTSIPKNKNNILFDTDSNLVLYNGSSENNTKFYNELLESTRHKTMQEYYRLLYVALTRVSHKLIICGWSNKDKIAKESWYSILKASLEILQNGNNKKLQKN